MLFQCPPILWLLATSGLADALFTQRSSPGPSSKAGLTWPNGNSIDVKQYLTTGKVSWYYDWSPDGSITDVEFVPMFWGNKSIDDWQSTINDTISRYSVKAVLGMNEPQEPQQSNLTPQQGAELWKTYIEPLKAQNIRLGSPAPSGNPNGKTWLQDWLTACEGGCNPDFIALHWYDVNSTQFKEYVADYHQTFNLPIWITEWACQNYNDVNAQCSGSDIVSLMNITESFLDAADYVERYAWFGAFPNLDGVNPLDGLMTSNGQINDLGKLYIGAESSNLVNVTVSSQSAPTVDSSQLNLSLLVLGVTIVVVACFIP